MSILDLQTMIGNCLHMEFGSFSVWRCSVTHVSSVGYLCMDVQWDISSLEQERISIHHMHINCYLVWSLVRRFDHPRKYKAFISRCVVRGTLKIGSLREVGVK